MEANDDEKTGVNLVEHRGDILQEKMEELTKIKEELKAAKDSATQSWLDSRPLIDELEKLQSGLASAKNQASMSNIVISELESQFEATKASIKSKMEEETKTTKMINEITQALEQLRGELDIIKLGTDEERRARTKLKQVLRMRRQTLPTLQLTLRATQIESEAFGKSAAEALGHIQSSDQSENSTIQLSQEGYRSLKRRAKEESSLAEWRISVSMEQKRAAEASRNLASSRLKELRTEKNRSRRIEEEKIIEDENTIKETEEKQDSRVKKEAPVEAREKAIGKSNSTNYPQQ